MSNVAASTQNINAMPLFPTKLFHIRREMIIQINYTDKSLKFKTFNQPELGNRETEARANVLEILI